MQIVMEPNDSLHEIATCYLPTEFKSVAIQHGREMLEFLHQNYEKTGYAIAGPQVGIPRRIFVFANGEVFIHPVILEVYGVQMPPRLFKQPILEGGEGCLSCGDLRIVVSRWESIKVQYVDINGLTIQKRLNGMKSVAFQHELDHLNGITLHSISINRAS